MDNKLPAKESSPSDDDEKGAAELNKKAICQFIQTFTNISLFIKVNLERKANGDFPSGKA